MGEWRISRKTARRFLLDSLLAGPGRARLDSHPTTAGELVERLEAVQIDPVARVGRNQDLVIMARDARYRPHDLDQLLALGHIFEYRANEASVLPMSDYPLFKGVRERLQARLKPELDRHQELVSHVTARIANEGPLPARAFVTEKKVLGYWDTEKATTKATSHVLNLLFDAGLVMVAQRQGVTRFFDLPERTVPPEVMARNQELSPEEADQQLFDKYLAAYRLISGQDNRLGWGGRPMAWRRGQLAARESRGALIRLVVEGVKAPYYVRQEDADRLRFWEGQERGWDRPIRFLPPLDNLLWDRNRLVDLFQFHYRWEVYVPPQKRAFGAYAMPVLVGDRLVGRIDPELKRAESLLVVRNVAWESTVRLTPRLRRDIEASLQTWAERLGASAVHWPTASSPLARAQPRAR